MSYRPPANSAIDSSSLLQSDYTPAYPSTHQSTNQSTDAPGSPMTPMNADGFKAGVSELVELRAEEAENDISEPARMSRSLMTYRAALGELCATFVLVYVACGIGIATNEQILHLNESIPDDRATQAVLSVVGPLVGTLLGSLTVAFIAMALIFSFASISGCHMNPAVTVAVWASRRTSTRKAAYYLLAQFIGANLSMLALLLTFNFDTNIFQYAVVKPGPKSNAFSIFAMEFLLTFILVFVIFKVAFESVEEEKKKNMSFKAVGGARGLTIYAPNTQSKLGFAPLAIGTTIGVLGGVGSSVSGGCYNPARYLAPAIWSTQLDWWSFAYVLGQLSGGCSAALIRHAFDVLGRKAQVYEGKAEALREQARSMQGA